MSVFFVFTGKALAETASEPAHMSPPPLKTSDYRVYTSDHPNITPHPIATINQQARQEMELARQNFRNQIELIKDARKKLIVENINDHIATANATLTTKMTKALTNLSTILQKLQEKSAALKTSGKDTGALDAAIAAAQTAITNAQNAVDTQSQKVYTATLPTNENGLKIPVAQMYSSFRQDILTVYQAVLSAKEAVGKAISELRKISGENTATGSAVTQ